MKQQRKIVIEEIARIALEDLKIRDYIAHELDLSDKVMEETYRHLKSKLNKH
jgi:hypothetical protein